MACARARENRAHCALQVDKMPDYEAHFRTTFGADPTGTDVPDREILRQTNPEIARTPIPTERFANVVDQDTVKELLKTAPTGKACGEDGIHGEMLQYAAEGLSGPVTTMFRIFTALCCVPTIWKVANVALTWKTKAVTVTSNNTDRYP
jgi:hypothetical protein